MVFQEPMTSLNPLQRIGRQVGEGLRLHRRLRGELRGRVLELLDWPASSSRDACSRPIRTSSPAASDSE